MEQKYFAFEYGRSMSEEYFINTLTAQNGATDMGQISMYTGYGGLTYEDAGRLIHPPVYNGSFYNPASGEFDPDKNFIFMGMEPGRKNLPPGYFKDVNVVYLRETYRGQQVHKQIPGFLDRSSIDALKTNPAFLLFRASTNILGMKGYSYYTFPSFIDYKDSFVNIWYNGLTREVGWRWTIK